MPKKKKERNTGGDAKLEMTPMIDVVFQLLIFFICTLKQHDILAQLDAMRPAPDPNAKPTDNPTEPVKINIDGRGIIYKGFPVSTQSLAKSLATIAKYNKKTTIVINCTGDSKHGKLVEVLDACSQNGLNSLAVFSL